MKKIISILTLIILTAAHAAVAGAADVAVVKGQVPVSGLNVKRSADKLVISMDLDMSNMKIGKDRQLTVIPFVYNADSTETSEFHPVYIAGHNLYYKHLRDEDLPDYTLLYNKGDVSTVKYRGSIPDAEWLNDSRLAVYYRIGGCCDATLQEGVDTLARLVKPVKPEFKPQFNYVTPQGNAEKIRELKRRAYINFPVNRMEIYPDYMNNPVELKKIINTIDSVKNDSDITITSIFIKGFASPESPYNNNTRLAKGRTATLKGYVESLYRFGPDFIKTDYEPEDWEGLREYIVNSSLANRDAILAVIDSDLTPDEKDRKLKVDFPSDYAYILTNIYPWLRHSDYKIDYTIRQFTSLDDILRVLATEPQKLSVGEFYIAAQSMKPGSPEFNNVFETAVRMYPGDPVANLNAANTALARGDYKAAAEYLNHAGDGPAAVYTRGLLAALTGQYDRALEFLSAAAKAKVADAPKALQQVQDIIKWNKQQADPEYQSTYIKLD